MCGDAIFSGHTAVCTLSVLFAHRYTPKPHRIFILGVQWSLLLFNAVLLVVSRWHYTVDVVLAYWLASALYVIYHMFCRQCHASRPTSDATLLVLALPFWVRSFSHFAQFTPCSGSKRTRRRVGCPTHTTSPCRTAAA